MKRKVLVAMSGGVDSSVAALLLKQKGFSPVGVHMKLWQVCENDVETSRPRCCSLKTIDDARAVAKELNIPFYVLDLRKDFQDAVIDYFCSQYLKGLTPNPCIICNKNIKFGVLMDYARKLGINYVASGHHARIKKDKHKRFLLTEGKDKNKDQSYFLFNLSQRQLKHILFPVGDYTKEQVRKLAREAGLKTQKNRESQEICFVPTRNYRVFLKQNCAAQIKPGFIVDKQGCRIGRHPGICFYTVGQREGLGVALGRPQYVTHIDSIRNQITIGDKTDLARKRIIAENVSWVNSEPSTSKLRVQAKFRYKHPPKRACLKKISSPRWQVEFSQPQFAITPGQAIAFYQKDRVLGGGWISARMG